MNKTFLYDEHVSLNAKMVDFAGFLMPVSYDSIINEHLNVRNHSGIFDVSHMGEIFVSGKDAEKFLQYVVVNNVNKLSDGKIIYTPICYENGGVVDDILIYKKMNCDYMIVANASNVEKVYNWLKTTSKNFEVNILNKSSEFSMVAIQGPKTPALMEKAGFNILDLKYYTFKNSVFNDFPILISRTGYTGEHGFEIILPNEGVKSLWNHFFKAGIEFNLKPIGLGARDTLRLEVCFSLYGHELTESINPIEADIGWTVDLTKSDFIGKKNLLNPVTRKLVGFEMVDKSIPRGGYQVFADNKNVGFVTSGSFLPYINKNMGLAIVNNEYTSVNSKIQIEIRQKMYNAVVVKKPFYSPFNKR